jgi:hypothetical protein
MAEHTFPWFPITFEVPAQNILWIGEAARYDHDENIVYIDDGYQARTFFVGAVDVLNENEMRWRSLTNDEPMRIRPTVAADAARWNYPGSLGIPLPTEIIGAIMTNTVPPPTLSAAVDDEGTVHTMILETGMGLYARYSASWIRMTDISPIEQLDIIDVPADDLDIYDAADQRGDTVNIRFLHPVEQPHISAVDIASPAAAITVASAAPVIISSAADLPDAVEHANTNVESRWYVERRWRSLGGPDTGITLPWLNGGTP